MIALLLAAACSGDCRAQALFETMERKLLSAAPLQLRVTSRAEGAVRAEALTTVSIGLATRLHAQGAVGGTPFTRDFDVQTTPALREAVVLGLTRMGLLHNVVNLSRGGGIEHADGTARDWLKAGTFRRARGGVRFAVLVEGKNAGFATLTIDARTRLPKKRVQVVHFPQGDMRVTETYAFPAK